MCSRSLAFCIFSIYLLWWCFLGTVYIYSPRWITGNSMFAFYSSNSWCLWLFFPGSYLKSDWVLCQLVTAFFICVHSLKMQLIYSGWTGESQICTLKQSLKMPNPFLCQWPPLRAYLKLSFFPPQSFPTPLLTIFSLPLQMVVADSLTMVSNE